MDGGHCEWMDLLLPPSSVNPWLRLRWNDSRTCRLQPNPSRSTNKFSTIVNFFNVHLLHFQLFIHFNMLHNDPLGFRIQLLSRNVLLLMSRMAVAIVYNDDDDYDDSNNGDDVAFDDVDINDANDLMLMMVVVVAVMMMIMTTTTTTLTIIIIMVLIVVVILVITLM